MYANAYMAYQCIHSAMYIGTCVYMYIHILHPCMQKYMCMYICYTYTFMHANIFVCANTAAMILLRSLFYGIYTVFLHIICNYMLDFNRFILDLHIGFI